ncbi:16S rRNA (cytidine(1402)-2'-O)-methyltransferase [Asaia bogorensis]|uniref:Ribosomal RNA small subunit methyltransferase I n=1 Tax=Asaia bogorensis NBRC 16594 TaxID=1231624 RepID=A0AAN4R0Q0_9PROT|nr:16S rRNA (cytidine(1402)-2'-O)-methyltransferase [Asaia bogorensis]MDR6182346.1 16S rRNA (cytidine1402-2'-O)-methyltransferase [Asaia bogorensis NBRC 16594]BAT19945.1 tetrapyrrole/corrin/porphyrin methyltransferase [Asaia bogorensis NBRC 16594]GBQ81025.1 tetrapyrrole/corrin/porphyrin methyltransferase [Asaia bogorensis NBRC 16594]GEL52638.1 ribosomal RNA small subunit methyltransferase I [Asaia bogorensis NBRC 16594]
MSDLPSYTHTPDNDSPPEGSSHPYDNSGNSATLPPGSLTLVATPIGNLGDISTRAIETLKAADVILCEDTRVTTKLLKAYNVSTPTQILHDHNEQDRLPALLNRMAQGGRLALVSDAGTPLVSDPGYRLTRAAIGAGLSVGAIPGANAATLALTLSGLPPHPYLFSGFASPRSSARRSQFAVLRAAEQAGFTATLIWYEAPHRLLDMLDDLIAVFGPEREAAVARELTKKFEEIRRGSLTEIREHFIGTAPRGEITVLVGPPGDEAVDTEQDLDARLVEALKTHSVKDAAALVAGAVNLPKRVVYARALEIGKS